MERKFYHFIQERERKKDKEMIMLWDFDDENLKFSVVFYVGKFRR